MRSRLCNSSWQCGALDELTLLLVRTFAKSSLNGAAGEVVGCVSDMDMQVLVGEGFLGCIVLVGAKRNSFTTPKVRWEELGIIGVGCQGG